MASTSRTRREEPYADDRSAGGKILRGRRNPRPTPYDRPSTVASPSPNWLTGVILPKIATGAATLLSSFISSPYDSDDSSSSEDDDDSRDASSADGSDESTLSLYFIDGVDTLNKEDASTPEFDKSLRKESQLSIVKSETKHLIEKLVMQETFSREERDYLMGIINSRVIDDSTRNGLVTRSDIPDFCTKAIMEAKQWIKEKESSSKLQQAHGIYTLKSIKLPQDSKGGLSSPVDMAKTYMRDHPWSSPLLNSVVEKTPSRVALEVLKDEASHSSFYSSKRKLSSGSWSIQDEIRRVRSKATEDMLKTVPSQIANISSFSLGPEGIENTLLNGRMELGLGGRLQDSNLFPSAKSLDASSNLTATGVSTSGGLPDFRVKDQSYPTSHGNIQLRGKATNNGFILSVSREVENNRQHSDDKDSTAISSHDKLAGRSSLEETCELLSETSVEIPDMNEVDGVAIDNSKQLTRPKNVKQVVRGKSAKVGIGKGRKLRPREGLLE